MNPQDDLKSLFRDIKVLLPTGGDLYGKDSPVRPRYGYVLLGRSFILEIGTEMACSIREICQFSGHRTVFEWGLEAFNHVLAIRSYRCWVAESSA